MPNMTTTQAKKRQRKHPTHTHAHTHTHTHICTLTFTRTQHTARIEATLVADNTMRIPQSDRAAAHMLRGAPTALRGSDADTAAALAPSLQPFESQLLDRHGDVRIADRDLQPGPLPNAVVLAPSPVDSFWLRGAELQALEPLRHFGQLFVQKSALGSGQRRRNSHRAQKQARLARNANALSTARTRDTRRTTVADKRAASPQDITAHDATRTTARDDST